MATNNKRREATRRQLEAQLRERQVREARRRRLTLIGSVVGSVAVVAAIVIIVVVASSGGGSGKKSNQAATSKSPSPSTSASSSAAAAVAPVAACTKPSGKSKVSFNGVTVSNYTDTSKQPTVTAKGTRTPPSLECQDLVVGKGTVASPSSTVTVHYTGVLYKNGTLFDSSYRDNKGSKPTSFSLAKVVPGFTQGIGGDGKVAPMRVGGVRVLVIPSSLGYGAQASGPIPANSSLVFVVHLVKVS